ncbi:MAG: hypothetical protein NVS4B7_06210 [Ktedonobacteraceae bacterium]
MLTIGAVILLVLGAFLFFGATVAPDQPQLSPVLVYVTAVLVGLIGFAVAIAALRIRRLPVSTGVEGMVGAQAVTATALSPQGRYGGEDWAAVLVDPDMSVEAGTEVQIVFVQGLRLYVQPMSMMIQNAERIEHAEHVERSMPLREQL